MNSLVPRTKLQIMETLDRPKHGSSAHCKVIPPCSIRNSNSYRIVYPRTVHTTASVYSGHPVGYIPDVRRGRTWNLRRILLVLAAHGITFYLYNSKSLKTPFFYEFTRTDRCEPTCTVIVIFRVLNFNVDIKLGENGNCSSRDSRGA